jgi:3-methyladenine DNA glycosylase AlkD
LNSGYAGLITDLQNRLEIRANQKTKDWWERYLKGAILFRGVKMGDNREALTAWYADHTLAAVSNREQFHLANSLLRQACAEDKLAGILYFQEILIPVGLVDWRAAVPEWAGLFGAGFIHDWNTCDWFCVKVLGPLSEREGEPCARAIANWRQADNLWQRRASGVAFVNLAARGDDYFPGFVEMMLETCAVTVHSSERFAQTGTGWVLRELSVAAPEQVARFIETHLEGFSREGLRYAIEKLPQELADPLLHTHRSGRR